MSDDTKGHLKALKIGEKLKTLRESAEMEIEEIAEKVGITGILVSQIENEVVPPTIATLLKMSKIFNIDMSCFFEGEKISRQFDVVRKEERIKLKAPKHHNHSALSYNYESLTCSFPGKHMQPFLVEFDVDVEEQLAALSHPGEEFHYILDGEVEFFSGNERILLKEGDSLYFDSQMPHRFIAKGHKNAKAVSIVFISDEDNEE